MQKGQLLEAILEQQEAVHKDGWNVATLSQHIKKSTSGNVATLQRPDVPTLRRQPELFFSIIKRQRGTEFEGDRRSGIVRTRARKSEQQ